jgi:hypothetical protein
MMKMCSMFPPLILIEFSCLACRLPGSRTAGDAVAVPDKGRAVHVVQATHGGPQGLVLRIPAPADGRYSDAPSSGLSQLRPETVLFMLTRRSLTCSLLLLQSQFGFDGHVSAHQYAAVAHAAHGHGVDSYDVAARHLQSSRPFHHPMQFNPGNPMLRVQSLPSVAVPFKNQYFMVNNSVPSSTVGAYGPR